MTIKKALLLFSSLIAIMLAIGLSVAIGLSEFYHLDKFFTDLSDDEYRHLFGVITLTTPLIAYGIIFKSLDFRPQLNKLSIKVKSLHSEILFYIFITALGLTYTIILHAMCNIFWFTLQYLGEPFYTWLFELKFNFIYWIMFVLGGVLICFALRRITHMSNSSKLGTSSGIRSFLN